MSDVIASAVAEIVLKQLKPLLEDIVKRLPEEGELRAINKGVGATLEQQAGNAQLLARLDSTMRNFADNFTVVVEEFRANHLKAIDSNNKLGAMIRETLDAHEKLGARVYQLEERRRGENGETTLAETGGE